MDIDREVSLALQAWWLRLQLLLRLSCYLPDPLAPVDRYPSAISTSPIHRVIGRWASAEARVELAFRLTFARVCGERCRARKFRKVDQNH
jgi:hypothetical protein